MAWENELGDQLFHQHQKYLAPTGLIQYYNLVIDHATGAEVFDVEGKRYIDLLGSASAMNAGHSNPHVIKAMKDQIDQLVSYDAGYFPNPTTIKLVERLAKIAPGNSPKKVSFGNSGSDANDGIIKFARAATGRSYIVSFNNSYHGTTFGAISAGACGPEMVRKIGPLVPNIVHVPYPDTYRCLPNETEHQIALRYFDLFMRPFNSYLPADEVACVLMEPIQGDAGIIKPPDEFVQLVYQFCQENGILFAMDEINQGLGRAGKMWASELYGIEPDLISVGKSLASGMPLSAVIGKTDVMEQLGVSAHVFTTAGNPICSAAAMATLDVIEGEHLPEKSAQDGEYAKQQFLQLQDKYNFIGDVRMYGLNGGIEIVKDRQTKERDQDGAAKIIFRAFQKGLILVKLAGNVLRFQPPLVITREQLDEVFAILDSVFSDFESGVIQLPEELQNMSW
ncbi:4-aminobutyrate aminotransferase [Paucilactobacillus hokkaidonensis JCM 18461]|uniref:4-aminobutyrate aminotransferase n=2 Tax=Paucilactobacillus hokkaidonensis TaxID=1193095 RepID=A0A0A1H0G9_9LACO|nr:aspartate aminotransferase family protein [Paucilactobacillus hokkaidonensis]KRO10436.1 4-aminobutyrate aminotransferase [Paucilactobacillus hokkaidonensis]BAP86753.1 4-aminobutyrate aminotransferase [Paucilactobacillus hokkaidonensis JCM 18461]